MDSKPMRLLLVSMVRDGILPSRDVIQDFFQTSMQDEEIGKILTQERIDDLFIGNTLQPDKLSNLGADLELGYGPDQKWPDEPIEIFCYAAALNLTQEKKPEDFANLTRVLQKKSFENRLSGLSDIIQEQREKSYQQTISVQTAFPEIEPLLKTFYSPAQMVLGARLDTAFEIYNKTNNLLTQAPTSAELQNLNQKALDFMQTVLNINDTNNLAQLMQERQQKSKTNPEFIPNRTPQLTKLQNFTAENKISSEQINKNNNLNPEQKDRARYNLQRIAQTALAHKQGKALAVNQDSKDEDLLQETKFLTPAQRDQNRAIVKNGEILQRQSDNSFTKVDTKLNISHQKDNYVAFVLNVQGELSLFNHFDMGDKIAHSSMNAQAAILSAGELKIQNGVIKELTAHSGHYRPFEKNIYEALKYLTQQGVDISQIDVRLITPQGEFSKKASAVYADMDKIAQQSPAAPTPARNSTLSIMSGLSSQNKEDPLLALLQKGTVGFDQIANELGTATSYTAPKIEVTSQQELKKEFIDSAQRSPTVR